MDISAAFSPCPNDTILFHALVHNLLDLEISLSPHLADIEELNRWAIQRRYPLIKVSCANLPAILDQYIVLPVGAAVGYGCGPKLVSKKPCTLEQVTSMRVAVPGAHTTAHLLLRDLVPEPQEKIFCSYDAISPMLMASDVDAGVIIHETRFCLEDLGLYEIADLGKLWETKYQVPVPLGCLVAERSLGIDTLVQLTTALQASLSYARLHPEASRSYIQKHAQELSQDVIQAHIKLYVSQDTEQLSHKAMAGIRALLNVADPSKRFADSWLLEGLAR